MNPIFEIIPIGLTPASANLFLEVNNRQLSFFFQNVADGKITGLSVFDFAQKDGAANTAEALRQIIAGEELLAEKFSQVFISYLYNESILKPAPYYNLHESSDDLNLIYGDLTSGLILTDYVDEKDIYNVYRIPSEIHELMAFRFTQATHFHKYSLLLKQLSKTGELLKVIFYPNKMVVTLQKQGKLQLVQSFFYTTSEDVLYYLLTICKQFDVQDINVQLGGLIEKDSALLKHIQRHFLTITFCSLPDRLVYVNGIQTFPPHYFSHLFAFALCV